jgi:hypothetical protein
MSQRSNIKRYSNEASIHNAMQALKQDANLTIPRPAITYSVLERTLRRRRNGTLSQCDCKPKSMKLLLTEEEAIIQYVLELDARGSPPKLASIRDMADSLLTERHRDLVGENWAKAFVKRQPELKVELNRNYDYKRALCEDPEVVGGCFRLVQNTKAKYDIQDEDKYNFDKTGFMIGQISTGPVFTAADRRGRPKTVQQGNPEWVTVI